MKRLPQLTIAGISMFLGLTFLDSEEPKLFMISNLLLNSSN